VTKQQVGAGPAAIGWLRAALYGPIRQLVSVQGWAPSHGENVVLKPITPKPNAARMINFVMGKPFCESGIPAQKG
jgi:hypothetical protein